jgi:hypothetical protein
MAGGQKNRKAATTKAARAAADHDSSITHDQDSCTAQDPCDAVSTLIQKLLASKDCSWHESRLYEDLGTKVARSVQFVQGWVAGQTLSPVQQESIATIDPRSKSGHIMALLILLSKKLLSARKRLRDWKQPDYSYVVSQAMSAAVACLPVVTQQEDGQANTSDRPFSFVKIPVAVTCEWLHQTAMAQEQVCQLL